VCGSRLWKCKLRYAVRVSLQAQLGIIFLRGRFSLPVKQRDGDFLSRECMTILIVNDADRYHLSETMTARPHQKKKRGETREITPTRSMLPAKPRGPWLSHPVHPVRSTHVVFTLPPHPPERTHPKPRKRQCETNCNHHTPKARLPGLIFRIFVGQRNPAAGRYQQENKPRNLQPQLMQHPPKGASRRRNRAGGGPHRPAAFGLLRRHPRHHPYLLCRRNLAHGLDFNSLRRYNDANL
jgi:hypothetical protein